MKKKTPIRQSNIYIPRSCASCPLNNLANTLLTAIVVERVKLVILSQFKLQSYYPKKISMKNRMLAYGFLLNMALVISEEKQ
jgi:hypothetical protein